MRPTRQQVASILQGVGYAVVFFGTLAAPFGVIVILVMLLFTFVGGWSSKSIWATGCGAIPILVIVAGIAIARLGDHLSEGRADLGLCIECGYDLRGEFDRGCPECGWNRDP